MKPTKILIAALRSAADRIEQTEDWDWGFVQSCNMGILAQEILNCNGRMICSYLRDFNGYFNCWSDISRTGHGFCGVTGLATAEITKVLHQHGIERKDYRRIENCSRRKEEVVFEFRQIANDLELERKTHADLNSRVPEEARG